MRISQQTEDEIHKLHSKGYGFGAIGRKLGISKSTARRYVLNLRQVDGVEVRK